MKKVVLSDPAAFLMILTVIGACFTAGTSMAMPNKVDSLSKIGVFATGYIDGTITNSSGAPVENAHIISFTTILFILSGNPPAFATASTDSNGNYQISVPEGRYFVIAGKLGRGFAIAIPVIVESGKTTTIDLSLTGGIFGGLGS
ncbi:MAG: carboxypeptidase regulatory-like domain-containing protein [Thermoplasmatales archaeon]|nr:MAG: carboxypeptidase regulatory-like domain-containing protein [Thermoplasmatales archaeon]